MRLRKIHPDAPDKERQADNALRFECTDCERKRAIVFPDFCFVDLDGPVLEVSLYDRRCAARRLAGAATDAPKAGAS